MKDSPEMKLTICSEYRIYSLGSRENMLESHGVFEGYISIGIDEVGMIIKLKGDDENIPEITRLVPLHTILAIDVINAKPHDAKDDDQEMPHYVG